MVRKYDDAATKIMFKDYGTSSQTPGGVSMVLWEEMAGVCEAHQNPDENAGLSRRHTPQSSSLYSLLKIAEQKYSELQIWYEHFGSRGILLFSFDKSDILFLM